MDMLAAEDRRAPNSEQTRGDKPKLKLQGDDAVAETLLISQEESG